MVGSLVTELMTIYDTVGEDMLRNGYEPRISDELPVGLTTPAKAKSFTIHYDPRPVHKFKCAQCGTTFTITWIPKFCLWCRLPW